MSLTLESDALVDVATEAVVAVDRPADLAAFVASCVYGNVLNATLGFGTVRQAVIDAGAPLIGTYEPNADVITYVGVPGGDPNPVTQLDLTVRADFQTAAAAAAWDSAIFDLDPTECYEDNGIVFMGSPGWLSTLGNTFATAGQRVVVISDRNDIDLSFAGFVLALSTLFGETYVHIFDSIGAGYVASPFGVALLPGYGWQVRPELTGTQAVPEPAAVDVPLDINPQLRFSEAIDPATAASIQLIDYSFTPVPGTVSLDGDNLVATFTPTDPLQPVANYYWSLSGVTNVGGTVTCSVLTDMFTTVALPLFEVIACTPADGEYDIDELVHPSVTFSRAIDPGTRDRDIYLVEVGIGGVTGTIALSAGDTVVTITPGGNLNSGSTYVIHVNAAVASAAADLLGSDFEQPIGFIAI